MPLMLILPPKPSVTGCPSWFTTFVLRFQS